MREKNTAILTDPADRARWVAFPSWLGVCCVLKVTCQVQSIGLFLDTDYPDGYGLGGVISEIRVGDFLNSPEGLQVQGLEARTRSPFFTPRCLATTSHLAFRKKKIGVSDSDRVS